MHYVHGLWSAWPVVPATIGFLLIFMFITILGIGESSKVATGIFIFHLFSLVLLVLFCGWYITTNGIGVLQANYAVTPERGISGALFFGFCAGMLGISGFESSANFVEEQRRGVFPKTLRNMWIVVSIFNPLMAFFALAIIPIPDVRAHEEALLSHMGSVAGGSWLSLLISIDAALVLSGAVLTSFVGISGLVERMTLDRILPPFLLKRNRKGSTYLIALTFFLLCTSILLITQGQLDALAGVYTIAFLAVMALFGLGNVLLKVRRKNLPRPERSNWIMLMLAIFAVVAAVIGNALLNPQYLLVFLEYFVPTILVITIMLNRVVLLKLQLKFISYFFTPIERMVRATNIKTLRLIDKINTQEFVYFTKNDDVATLNKVMLYIKHNEHTRKLKVVAVLDEGESVPSGLMRDVDVLDREYPEIKIEFVKIKGEFGPQLIKKLSKQWDIPINFMFIASPGDHFPYRVEELGGVRLII